MKFSPNVPIVGSRAAQLALPVAVGLGLVDVHGAVLAAVADEVGLPVAVDVEPPDRDPPGTGAFQMAVRTVLPRHGISRGLPTLTDKAQGRS